MLTYRQALAEIIEPTAIGYSIRSQDRLWVVFTFDTWSMDEFRYNRLYPLIERDGWAYDLDIPNVPVFLSRREAENYAESLTNHLARKSLRDDTPEVYVMNLGDSARYEAGWIGYDRRPWPRQKPKFKGSQRAWDAMTEMHHKWAQENSKR